METRKTYCIYHPSQLITNFCKQKQCLLPLCPTCICLHMEFHTKRGTPVLLDNINQTIVKTNNSLYEMINKLENSKNRMINIEQTSKELTYKITEMLFQAKISIKEVIDKKFTQIQNDILTTIQKKNNQIGLHCPDKIQAFQDKLTEETNLLAEMVREIKGDKSMQTLIQFLGKRKILTQIVIRQSQEHIDLSNQYKVEANIDKNVITQLSNMMTRLVNIRFNLPSVKQNLVQNVSNYSKNKNSQLSQSQRITDFRVPQNQPQVSNIMHTQQPVLQLRNNSLKRSTFIPIRQTMKSIENVRPSTPIIYNLKESNKYPYQTNNPVACTEISKLSRCNTKENLAQKKLGISLNYKTEGQSIKSKQNTLKQSSPSNT